jgi:hypothetical protein
MNYLLSTSKVNVIETSLSKVNVIETSLIIENVTRSPQ